MQSSGFPICLLKN